MTDLVLLGKSHVVKDRDCGNPPDAKTTTTTITILAFAIAMGLFAAAAISAADSAFAVGGPKGEKNFGQCEKDFNEKSCRHFHTGS